MCCSAASSETKARSTASGPGRELGHQPLPGKKWQTPARSPEPRVLVTRSKYSCNKKSPKKKENVFGVRLLFSFFLQMHKHPKCYRKLENETTFTWTFFFNPFEHIEGHARSFLLENVFAAGYKQRTKCAACIRTCVEVLLG